MNTNKDKNRSAGENPVPKAVVSRLSLYLRELQRLVRDEKETTSSTQLGKMLGFTDAQVRKDLAYFGQFGYPGVGYRCSELIDAIKQIMGTNRSWPVLLVGVGNLGRALLGHKGFSLQGFHVVAAIDNDPTMANSKIDNVQIEPFSELESLITESDLKMAILAVPAAAAQQVAEQLVDAGIQGILNFAPVTLKMPEEITVIGVDLAIELEQLSFAMTNRPDDLLPSQASVD
ncbi:MAG: redox-sensing transcriptional repressor Rex [Pirellulales bacterium]